MSTQIQSFERQTSKRTNCLKINQYDKSKEPDNNAIRSVHNTVSDMNLRHHLEDFKIGDNSLTMRILNSKLQSGQDKQSH